jgi:hypothetical protein
MAAQAAIHVPLLSASRRCGCGALRMLAWTAAFAAVTERVLRSRAPAEHLRPDARDRARVLLK